MKDSTQHRRYQLSTGGLVYQETPDGEVLLLPLLDKNGVRVEASSSPTSQGYGQDNSAQVAAGFGNVCMTSTIIIINKEFNRFFPQKGASEPRCCLSRG